ncbi:hypothetical protein EAI_09395 [Harpegnathos saltator]|uniref:Uncharacterized protein n=1 Tax=Harpegnathos saltator TaxID=610380 RepID=E2BQH8_HARSA|nr:hypothetical protein EAI_09395 [Harpegnathos saltator]
MKKTVKSDIMPTVCYAIENSIMRNFAVSNGLVNLPTLYNAAGFCGLCLYKDTYGLATNHSCVSGNPIVVDSSLKDQPHYSSSGSETSDNPPNIVSTM